MEEKGLRKSDASVSGSPDVEIVASGDDAPSKRLYELVLKDIKDKQYA
jgi:hypothetical protein